MRPSSERNDAEPALSNKAALRDSWEAYANKRGLIGEAPVQPAAPKGAKYRNVKVQVDGHTFDSKKEAGRYQELKYMQQAGKIADLELQPVFPLHVMRLAYSEVPIRVTQVGVFTADFSYLNLQTGEFVIEDVKSYPTRTAEAYRLRRRVVEAIHGITITEV